MTQEKYTAAQLAEILAAHRKWANGESGGSRANLSGAYLSGANLSGANLSGAYLSRANLSGAYLSRANLSDANLSGAYLSGAYLSGANLSGAYLSGAYLSGANLSGANLSRANLSDANLSDANLSGANLSGANLSRAKNLDPKHLVRRQIVPESGAFEGYKRVTGGGIVHLRVPADAKRSGGAVGRKCRAEFAEVISGSGVSTHDGKTNYEPGKTVRCHEWNPDPAVECGGGIHFFLTRLEAEEYQ